MKTIHKYPIPYTGENEIEMPKEAEILHVGPDPYGQLCIWAKVDTDIRLDTARFFVAGTGLELPKRDLRHLGSAVCGQFVWHIFLDEPPANQHHKSHE